MASLLITWNMFTVGQAASTTVSSGNDQVKQLEEDDVNMKPV